MVISVLWIIMSIKWYKIFLSCSTYWTNPIIRDFFILCSWSQSSINISKLFIINESTWRTKKSSVTTMRDSLPSGIMKVLSKPTIEPEREKQCCRIEIYSLPSTYKIDMYYDKNK
jgi:hypothetical protein